MPQSVQTSTPRPSRAVLGKQDGWKGRCQLGSAMKTTRRVAPRASYLPDSHLLFPRLEVVLYRGGVEVEPSRGIGIRRPRALALLGLTGSHSRTQHKLHEGVRISYSRETTACSYLQQAKMERRAGAGEHEQAVGRVVGTKVEGIKDEVGWVGGRVKRSFFGEKRVECMNGMISLTRVCCKSERRRERGKGRGNRSVVAWERRGSRLGRVDGPELRLVALCVRR